MRSLRLWDTGPDVTLLQRILAAAGLYLAHLPAAADESGVFGMETALATHKWQADRGLVPDGFVGPLTWASFAAELHLTQTAGPAHQLTSHFALHEFACTHCQRIKLRYLPELTDLLESIRDRAGVPLKISSGYRCQVHNASIPNASPVSQHLVGRAADLHWDKRRIKVDRMATIADDAGARGRGIYPWGIHVDTRPVPSRWDLRPAGQ